MEVLLLDGVGTEDGGEGRLEEVHAEGFSAADAAVDVDAGEGGGR